MLSCSHAGGFSLQQKSLFTLFLSLISSDCLRWDCQPIHKAPSTFGAVLLTAPSCLHIHI